MVGGRCPGSEHCRVSIPCLVVCLFVCVLFAFVVFHLLFMFVCFCLFWVLEWIALLCSVILLASPVSLTF